MDTIPRERLVKAVTLLGYDPSDVFGIAIRPNEVQVLLFERDEHGNKIVESFAPFPYKTRVEVSNVS